MNSNEYLEKDKKILPKYIDNVTITISGNGIFSVEPMDVLRTKAANEILENAKSFTKIILSK
jgi:hypothetical protein